ncbi:ankyrin repeat-containing domain protein [Mycena maculata]|uniref:Ankyrin repeat-containing domain protein n=1 Tax=Mycena maculata TaxID=230809 RepID=A0AAD7IR46_9AGAR|nr:ankyrin repeat-containing domain protein [Mycena maculata]
MPPELILLLSPLLSTSSLNAFTLGCRRLCEILQPELESRITPELAQELLLWAAPSKPHVVAKLVSPPHSVNPSYAHRSLYAAAEAGNTETTLLLLQAGADPAVSGDRYKGQAFHAAAMEGHLAVMRLLLDHGAPIDDRFRWDCSSESVLHYACSLGHLEMMELLISRGAKLESIGHYGTALGFAVHSFKIDAVKFLLRKGANAAVTVPLFIYKGGHPQPHTANLLYIAMGLRHPVYPLVPSRRRGMGLCSRPSCIGTCSRPSCIGACRWCLKYLPRQWKPADSEAVLLESPKWEGLPLREDRQQLMALLLAHGASKNTTMETISEHLVPLARTAKQTKEEYLEVVERMIEQAENAVPDVLSALYNV